MIPTAREDVYDLSLALLERMAERTSARGRFIALYLGLRRMGREIVPLGGSRGTPAAAIEQFLDALFTKTHQAEPFVVLTALFGQSTSPSAPYSARTGVLAPGRRHPTNTWRNNFAIQKGIGCPAEPATIASLLDHPDLRLGCEHMAIDPDGKQLCGIADTAYRGDEHSIWLRTTGDGYQVVDLDNPMVYEAYLSPGGFQLPIFPLIGALYSFASQTLPVRPSVGIPEFAEDFRFTFEQVAEIFDCDPTSVDNAAVLTAVESVVVARFRPEMIQPSGAVREPGASMIERPANPLPTELSEGILNTGLAAALSVAADLGTNGWDVLYRGNQPGVGYDLEAMRDGEILRIEVKSSVSFTTPELTEAEWSAAQQYGSEYVLAVVDFVGSSQQRIWYVRDPAGAAVPATLHHVSYRLARADVLPLSVEADFL